MKVSRFLLAATPVLSLCCIAPVGNAALILTPMASGTAETSSVAPLVQGTDGNFYGSSFFGGSSNTGTIFKMTPNGAVTTLALFDGTNGANPVNGLIQGSDGNFYGSSFYGGIAYTNREGGYARMAISTAPQPMAARLDWARYSSWGPMERSRHCSLSTAQMGPFPANKSSRWPIRASMERLTVAAQAT